ncbi:MAG: hypothetical protein KA712_12480 [Myxococcales bacterium]|nr:hypothetical protein [Myxococcales bacterium]
MATSRASVVSKPPLRFAPVSWLAGLTLFFGVACRATEEPSPEDLGPAGGGSGGSAEAPPVPASRCTPIALATPAQYQGKASFWGNHLGAGIDVDLGGGGYHKFTIRFGQGKDYRPRTGTFPLGTSPNGAFATCHECVMVMENVWGDNVNTLNFASSGSITIEAIDLPHGAVRGRVENVIFQPLTYTNQHHVWAGFKEDTDHCLFLSEARFDTFAGEGEACATSSDCRNHATQVCDPRAGHCVPTRCGSHEPCGTNEVCVLQNAAYDTQACFPACEPWKANGCPQGLSCVTRDYAGKEGVCKVTGTAAVGRKECPASNTSTGCVSGAVCQTVSTFWPKEQYCFETCDFFGDGKACSSGICQLRFYRNKDFKLYCYDDRCHRGGTCERPERADPAALGARCAADANRPCGVEAGVARGVCDADTNNTCLRLCRLGEQDCPTGQACAPYFIRNDGATAVEGIGVCR